MKSENRSSAFRAQLDERVMVADGAMGSMLYSKGVFINRCYDELNLSSPEIVRGIHREYAKAGAEILETNTFGANRMRLGCFGLGEKLREINQAGVRLAREAAAEGYVAGAVGPLGTLIEPLGPTSYEEARSMFSEQIEALMEAGIDLIILETFSNLEELREAAAAARAIAGNGMVVVAQVTIDDYGNLRDGTDTATFARYLDSLPVDVIGCNCSAGPKVTLETVEKLMQYSRKKTSAMPNAGHPARVEGRNIYLCSPEYMAQYARRFIWAGVKIIGGCCGTTPEHIKLVKAEVRSLNPVSRELKVELSDKQETRITDLSPHSISEKSALGEKLAAGKLVSFVEILPPRGVDPKKEIEGARLCAAGGVDCINVPDGPRASARMSASVACQLIQQHAGIEAVLHFCCRDRNILGIQSELLGAHAAGIHNLICITGDPPRMGTYPDATAVFDVDSIGLVNMVHNLNCGQDIGGNPMGSQTRLLIGVGANPAAVNIEEELRRLDWKVKAGAEFIVTQPVFDVDLFESFIKQVRHTGLPVIAGIWPLVSYRNAEFMVNELRIPVPQDLLQRMQRAGAGETALAEGIEIARMLVRELKNSIQGVQISAPFGRYQAALDVLDAL